MEIGGILRWSCLLLAISAIASRDTAWGQTSPAPSGSLARQIDHIVINSDHPEQVFRLFSEKFGLPLGWPYKSYGTFSSGGVGLGNVIIEFTQLAKTRSGVASVALEPGSVAEAVTGLDARGLKRGAPNPVLQKDRSGADRLGWTTIRLQSQLAGFFFCKYEMDVNVRRATMQRELEERVGGPLGIEAATEVVVGARDMAAAEREFRGLLGEPRFGEKSVWAVGSGPAIRLIADKEDHLAMLRVRVKSLDRARAFLRGENLLGEDTGREISLELSTKEDTGIRFVE
jgi:hypothetical protein